MKLILSESRRLRFFTFTMLYLAQGFPFGLVNTALPAYLAERGESAVAIASFIAIANLPWSFKLLAGPFMDRWTFLAMGKTSTLGDLCPELHGAYGFCFCLFPVRA